MVPYDQQPGGRENSPAYELVDQPSPARPTPTSAATPSTTQQQCDDTDETEEPEYY